jgi:Xaa-Pro aminopeptidase
MSAERPARLRELIIGEDLEALIVEGAANLRYLTGFTGSSGVALLQADGSGRFFTDFRYETQAAQELDDTFACEIVSGELTDALAAAMTGGRVGFDDATMSVRRLARLREHVSSTVELVASAGLPERLRAVKDEGEIEAIAAAARLIDELFGWLFAQPLEGRTEREVMISLEHEMRLRGATAPSFASIVAAGAHAALPHAQPSEARIQRGTLVTFDIGALLDGYCSDCTRTVAVGEPDARAREVYEIVLAAQLAGLEAVVPGVTARDADAQARAVIEQAGYGERFGHGLGHGVGMEVHEGPRLSRTAGDEPLQAGNVVTVEPGVYLPGRLGVRIEDLVLVTEDGHELMNGLPKSLTVIS